MYTVWTRCINTRGLKRGVWWSTHIFPPPKHEIFYPRFFFFPRSRRLWSLPSKGSPPLAPVIYPWHEINHRYLDYSLAGYFREFPRLRFYRIVSRRAIATTTSATTTTTVGDREDGGSFVCFRFHPHCEPPPFWSPVEGVRFIVTDYIFASFYASGR